MGHSYANYTVRCARREDVVAALAGRRAFVSPVQDELLVVWEETSDLQDPARMSELAIHLSGQLHSIVLALFDHDDDILWYQLVVDGRIVDEYDSAPDFFDADSEQSGPTGGDGSHLCDAFGVGDASFLNSILAESSYDETDGYIFAWQRHLALVQALRLPEWAVGTSYAGIAAGQLPQGLAAEDLIATT
jgi:hypothetical protein